MSNSDSSLNTKKVFKLGDYINVKPNPNEILRDENGVIIPPEGRDVPFSTFWSRRIKRKELQVSAVTPPKTDGSIKSGK